MLQVLQLPLVCVAMWFALDSGLKVRLDTALAGKPGVEIALYLGLACVPLFLAQTRLLSRGFTKAAVQFARLLSAKRRRSIRRSDVHVVRAAAKLLESWCQNVLFFCAANLALNAVPQDFVVPVPKVFRFLDTDGNGVLEAAEIEDWVQAVTGRLIVCIFGFSCAKFCLTVKKPPGNWGQLGAKKPPGNWGQLGATKRAGLVERYWTLTGQSNGWKLVDRIISAAVVLKTVYLGLYLFKVSDARMVVGTASCVGIAAFLAQQELMSNVVAMMIILVTNRFQVGDRVETGNQDIGFQTGIVRRISWDSTLLELDSGGEVKLPNSQLLDFPTVVLSRVSRDRAVLEVYIAAAHGLRNTDFWFQGVSDPYVVATVGAFSFQTEVVRDCLDPVWDSAVFAFEVGPQGEQLHLEVFDEDIIGFNESLGKLQVDFRELSEGVWHPRCEALTDGDGAELSYSVRIRPCDVE